MTINKKHTKRALLMSVVSLLLCCSMLVGTTYAWFTDSETSGVNQIVAGNLDIELEYKSKWEDSWTPVDSETKIFNENALYEPGYTEVVFLRVSNAGSLALKYNMFVAVGTETPSTNVYDEAFKLSDHLQIGTYVMDEYSNGANYADILMPLMFGTREAALQNSNPVTLADFDGAVSNMQTVLLAGEQNSQVVALVLTMPESVGNEANYKKGAEIPKINLGVSLFATQHTAEKDSFNSEYDKDAEVPVIVRDADHAQAVLDNLESGATIQLLPGVDYGTLEVRAQVASENKKPVASNANTKPVDYFTTKYPTGEYTRIIEDVTIIGAPGAKVDGIKFVTGTFKVDIPETGKQSGTMYQWVEIKNLVIDGVEFTDASTLGAGAGYVAPIFIDLQSVKVDGLTVKNCKLEGNKSNMNFVYAYGSAAKDCDFGITLNNVVIADNTVSGVARLCELREANNVTIQGNTVKNTTRELALLANNTGMAYSGNIIVSGNVADKIATDYVEAGKEGLFFRVGVGGDANIVVKDNVISNSGCVEGSFVSVTGHTGTLTVEGNTLG